MRKEQRRYRIPTKANISYRIVVGLVLLGPFLTVIGAAPYYGGTKEHQSDSRMGPGFSPAQPSGLLRYKIIMICGLSLFSIGAIGLTGTGTVHIIYRLNRHIKNTTKTIQP